jgi:hypothetical protein
MKSVDLVTVRLTFSEGNVRATPHHLRGAIAARFPDEPLFHQHAEEGIVYRMPRIQYRWDETGAMLVGLEEGARRLVEVPWPGMEFRAYASRAT